VLDLEIHFRIAAMGLRNDWVPIGSSTVRAQGGEPGAGEGDSTNGPRARIGRDRWPTLVIEAGFSETLSELQADMRWWFAASEHQVKIVLLAKFNHETQLQSIILEKWVETFPPRRVVTRSSSPQPMLSQTITIERAPENTATQTPARYVVTSGALRLEFRLLFLRDPREGESDVIINVQDLERYAATVWEANE
jgi:hypothetical protein